MAGKFEVYKDKAGEFRFRLKAGNGEIILTGESYKAKTGVMNGIESIRKNAADRARFEVKESKKGEPYFVLKAANHQVIGQSEMYSAAAARENDIKSLMNNAPDAKLVAQT